jgi:hypothetical protein
VRVSDLPERIRRWREREGWRSEVGGSEIRVRIAQRFNAGERDRRHDPSPQGTGEFFRPVAGLGQCGNDSPSAKALGYCRTKNRSVANPDTFVLVDD